MAKTNNSNPCKVITSVVRFSYLNAIEPKSANEGATAKYSVSLIISKEDTALIDRIRKAIEAAYHEGEFKLRGNAKVLPPITALKTPLRDGDVERSEDPAYKGSYFINANSSSKPDIVDAALNPIIDNSEVYSGMYGRASITFYAYNNNGNKGIACGLGNLQKIRDGEPLGSKSSAEADFADSFEDGFLD